MENNYYNAIVKRCYKCDESVLQNLNIFYDNSNSTIVLWNKFQIFIYENLEFECAAKVLIPEFLIQSVLSSSNYLICLDNSGNVQTTSLKFKNPSQKRFKTSFQIKEEGVLACVTYSQDLLLSLKCESNTYFLFLNKTNTDLQFVRKILLICNEDWDMTDTRGKLIFSSHLLREENSEKVKKAFKIEENIQNEWSLIIMSFDKRVIYVCLFNPKISEEHITVAKLYTCPSEICNIEIIEGADINIVIGLTIGTIIRLSLIEMTEPEIVHLNTAIHKLLIYNSIIIYTDGITTWKAEDILSKNIKFTKLFIKNIYNFLKIGDQIICTTFSNLIYTFQINDESVYLKLQTTDEYCTADTLIKNSEYLQKIMEEVDKNSKLVARLNREGRYITALSLSNRQDIMDGIVTCKVMVYEDYEGALTENAEAKFTEDFVEYHHADIFVFFIHIATVTEHKLDDVLSNALGDVQVHLTLSNETKILKTTSVRIAEKLKKSSLLIPLRVKNMELTEINVNIKLISNIPGALDAKQTIWTVLYRKNIKLNSEHFIKTIFNSNRIKSLQETEESLQKLTLQVAKNMYGNIFEFNEMQLNQPPYWSLYVKLPTNYKSMFNSKEYYERIFNSNRASYLLQQFSEDFFTSKSDVTLVINNEKVNIQIENDGFSYPLLKVTCGNMKVALNIRNFLANVICNDFANFGSDMEYISTTFYTTVENLQKAVQECIAATPQSEELYPLIEQFERHIVGALPM